MSSDTPRVNGERLVRDLASLARVGGTPAGGVSRPAYSDLDVEARGVVREWMRAAGLDVTVDAAGNTFGRRAGREPLPPLVIGSHTDSVPDGGRFDGPLGVLSALEVARTLDEQSIKLRHPLEVVDFQNEEGGLVGSRIVAGRFEEEALGLRAVSGFTIGEGIARLGGNPENLREARRKVGSIGGYLELHIEQGRILERAKKDIGVVEGLVGINYWEVTFEGVASHAGTTPMADRHDALLAAARFVDAVHETVIARPGRHVGTVGRLAVFPGGANVIPGRVVLTLELRDLDPSVVASLFEDISARANDIVKNTGTSVSMTPTHSNAPSPTHPGAQDAVRRAAAALGLTTYDMVSGAGHDAQNMAVLGPAGMIFVPSVNGISHSPVELTKDEDCVNGANVLLGALLQLDSA
jgi:N-carbamoyl-L-amino-acid hydrolase